MRLALLAMATAFMLAAGDGCQHNLAPNGCGCQTGCQTGCQSGCQSGCRGGCQSCLSGKQDYIPPLPHGQYQRQFSGPSGPPTGAYAYPYYTTRGPRDFLLDSPPTVGR